MPRDSSSEAHDTFEAHRHALTNPVWHALASTHQHFRLQAGLAIKYPAAVTPYAALADSSAEALSDLATLLEPGETTYVVGERPARIPELVLREPLPVLQMVYPTDRPLPEAAGTSTELSIVPLTWADAPAMVALTDVAFPGFFRARTCEMGTYYGVWQAGRLIAMAGERLCLNPLREVSGVCTHPDWRGRGLASRLMARLMQDHRRDRHVSWLYVVSTNRNAIELYLRMGYEIIREDSLHGLSLAAPPNTSTSK